MSTEQTMHPQPPAWLNAEAVFPPAENHRERVVALIAEGEDLLTSVSDFIARAAPLHEDIIDRVWAGDFVPDGLPQYLKESVSADVLEAVGVCLAWYGMVLIGGDVPTERYIMRCMERLDLDPVVDPNG